jgi:hypothetical protein
VKELSEIVKDPRLRNVEMAMDGFRADIHIGGWDGSLIVSHGGGWNHASVSPYAKRIIPSWSDMCALKEMIWNDDETVIQIHPPKDQYVNNVPNCLHLWECYYKPMVLPPSVFVGIRKGQTPAQMRQEIKEAYELAGEKYE